MAETIKFTTVIDEDGFFLANKHENVLGCKVSKSVGV